MKWTWYHAGVAVLLAALPARADFPLPAVPTGGTMRVEITLSGLPPGGVLVQLTVPSACGSFPQGDSIEVPTGAAGTLVFDFIAGQRPGPCTIEGRSGPVVERAHTTIYRPSALELVPMQALNGIPVGFRFGIAVQAKADGQALWGIPVEIDAPPAQGASATIATRTSTSNQNGYAFFDLVTNQVPGIYDLTMRSGAATRIVRIVQDVPAPAPEPNLPGGRSMRVDFTPPDKGPIRVSILEGAAACAMSSASYFSADHLGNSSPPPPGTVGFPLGMVQFGVHSCPRGSTITMAFDYPTPLPQDGRVATLNGNFLPATVQGNRVTFSVTDNGPADSNTGDFTAMIILVGVAQPGVRPPELPIPMVKDLWWGGIAENGWGMSLSQAASNNLFGAVFGYDDAGQPTWWVMSGGFWDTAGQIRFKGTLQRPRLGTPWYAYDAARLVFGGPDQGPVLITFADASRGSVDYTIAGVTGRKQIERQVFGAPGASGRPDVGGMWWGGISQSGWGVAILQQGAALFSVWYTYDETQKPTWFVLPDGRWTNAETYEGRIYRTTGSPWLGRPYDPSLLRVTDVGPYRLRFSAAGGATMDFSVLGRTGSLALVRQAPF